MAYTQICLRAQTTRSKNKASMHHWKNNLKKFSLEGNFPLGNLNPFLSASLSSDLWLLDLQQMLVNRGRSKNILGRNVFLAATWDHSFFPVCPGPPCCWWLMPQGPFLLLALLKFLLVFLELVSLLQQSQQARLGSPNTQIKEMSNGENQREEVYLMRIHWMREQIKKSSDPRIMSQLFKFK